MSNPLAQTLSLPCGQVLPNRLGKSAMTEGLADPDDNPTQRHQTLYRRWVEGGTGLLLTGNVMVDRRYLERAGNVVVDDAVDRQAMRDWAQAAQGPNTACWVQMSHSGRQCTKRVNAQPVAPSPVQLDLAGRFGRPRALSESEIHDIIEAFGRTAKICQESGFNGVQIHAAHGYLISEFLSPLINQRNDSWGGSLENRARLLMEVVAKVRQDVGAKYPIGVKLNSADFQKGGFSLEECVEVAGWLSAAGIDLLEISGGSYEQPQVFGHEGMPETADRPKRDSTLKREAYFLEYAEEIRKHLRVPLMITGGFRTGALMVRAVEEGLTDVVGLARPLVSEPDLSARLLEDATISAQDWQDKLVLGPGRLGPTSPWFLVKLLNIQGEVNWYYRQIERLSLGKSLLDRGGILQAYILHEWRDRLKAKRRRFNA